MKLQARFLGPAALALGLALAAGPAWADKIRHPTVVFAGLDKITGRIINFDVSVDETVQFGSIQITPRVCYTRPATEAPQTTSFVEVDDMGANNEIKRIFSGWMFAASPGLHGVEHPVYDIWLKDCRGGTQIIPSPPETADLRDAEPPPARPAQTPRQRQQARPVSPGPLPPAGSPQQNVPDIGAPVEVGPPPGETQRRRQAQPQQQPLAPPPSARDAPIGLLPPANIPGAR